LMDPVLVSVALMFWVPDFLNVTVKTCTPASPPTNV